jgi:hypothetical protein
VGFGGGKRRFGEDKMLLKFVQTISSIGPVELKKLRLFRGTPVCSRQTPILQPTAIGGVGSTVGANHICKQSTFCINCKDQGFGFARFLVVLCIWWPRQFSRVKRVARDNRVFRISTDFRVERVPRKFVRSCKR